MRKYIKEDATFTLAVILHLAFYALLFYKGVSFGDLSILLLLDGLVMLFFSGVVKHSALVEAPFKVGLIVGHPLFLIILILIFVWRQIDKLVKLLNGKSRKRES